MHKPSYLFDRTPEQKRDLFKSWARDDQAFFANGACHILAELFVQLHLDEGYKMIYLKPAPNFPGNHVYASNGEWAFDHNGWNKETDLLELTTKAYEKKFPGWSCRRITIEPSMTALEDFCKQNNHRLPWQYAYLPWTRTYNYIAQFDGAPPSH